MRMQRFFPRIFTLALFFVSSASASSFTITGMVHPRAEVTLKSKVHGEIRRILVKEGQWTKKGAVLMEFDNDREGAMMELAEARLRQARAALEVAKTMLLSSQKELKRQQGASDVVPRKSVEDAEDLVSQHEATISVRKAEISAAEAEIKLRKAELDDTYVHAPFDGVMTELIVEEGEVVKALEVDICKMVALDELYVEASIPADLFGQIRLRGLADVQVNGVNGGSSKRFKGWVSFVNPVVDPASKTFKVKVQVRSPHGPLRPGMTAEVTFP